MSEAPAAPGESIKGSDGPLDESTELFTADNGERGIRVSPVRQWYQSKSGEWSKIDVKLALERGSKNVVVSSGDRVAYRFGPTSDGVSIDDGQGGTLGFRPVGAKVDPVVGEDGRSVTYPEVWPGVDLVYAVSPAGLKEDVVIKRPQLLSEFDFVVTGAEVAPIDRLEDGTALMPGTMEVRNAGKSVGLTVLPPVATDATGAPVFQGTSGMALKIDAGERRGGDQVLSVSADPKWLGSLSADEFPVRLDPLVGIGSGATAWVTLAMYRPTGLFGAQCTSASAGCNQSVGYATGYNFRTNIGFNLAPMWATVAAHPGVQISNARFVAQGASAAEPWGARAPIPIGSELNYYIADLLPGMGDTTIGAGGTGIMDVTSFLQVWRVAREGGDTYFDSPMVAYVGNEAGPSWTQFPVSWLEVYFVNRAPSVSQVSPAPVSSNSLPTVLTASGSDPDGDPIQYQFTICEYNGVAESGCEDSAWQSGNSISLSAFSKVIYWNNMYTWRVKVRDGSGAHGYSATWWFHGSLPDPGFPSWRGGDDPYSGFAGGVNLATGNYFATQTDVSVSSLGSTLDVERSYNSLDTRVGLFGQGWSSVFDTRLDAVSGPGGVWLYRPDGRSEFYGRNSNGTFQSPFGYGSTLAYSGSKYILTEVDGTVTEFATSGVITLKREPLGQETRFVWSGGSPVSMSSYTSSSATVAVRTLTFTTTTSGSNVLVTSVKTESVTGQGQLSWTYGYSGTRLAAVNDPEHPSPSTVRTDYTYDASGRLTKWTRPGTAAVANTTEIELDYNAAGKVAWRKDGVGSQYTYDYATVPVAGEALRVTVTGPANPSSNTTVWGFDDRLRLVARVNEAGKTRTWAYHAVNGFLEQVVFEDAGHSETYERNGAGLVTKQTTIQDGVSRVSYFEYDSLNRKFAARDPRSASASDTTYMSSTTYVGSTRVVATETMPGRGTTTYTWTNGSETAAGGGGGTMPPNLLKSKSVPIAGSGGSTSFGFTTYSYDAKGNLITTVDHLGKTTTYTCDEIGRELTRTETGTGIASGATWTTTYDKLSRAVSVLEPSVTNAVTSTTTQLRTDTTFDGNGNVARVDQVPVVGGGTTRTTTYTYDTANRKTSETVAHGTSVAATTTYSYDAMGNVASTTDPLGRVYTTTFTATNLADVTKLLAYQPDPEFVPATSYDLVVQDLEYDDASRVVSEFDAEGRRIDTVWEHDQKKQRTLKNFQPRTGSPYDVSLETHEFDEVGNPTKSSFGNLVGSHPAKRIDRTFDPAGAVTKETLYGTSGTAERETRTDYDAAGNTTKTVIEGYSDTDRETRSAYSTTTGTLTSSTVENGSSDLVTQYTYNARGDVVDTTDPRGEVSTISYDRLGRAVSVQAPSVTSVVGGSSTTGRPEVFTGYNAFGEKSHTNDANGNITTYSYDAQGRETLITYPTYTPAGSSTALTPTQATTYDLVGNTTSSTDRRGKTTLYVFDKLNRNVKTVAPGSAPSSTVTSYVWYDKVGNTIKTLSPSGAVQTATYDMLNQARTKTVEVRQPSGPAVLSTTTFDYNTVGNQTWQQDPLGKVTTATFNAGGDQLTVTDPLNHTASKVYNAFGEVVRTIDPTNIWIEATFDQAGRQLTQTQKGIGGTKTPLTTNFTYNATGQRTKTVSPEGVETAVTWDAAGRMTAVQVGTGGEAASTQLAYDPAGNNTRITDGRGNETNLTYQQWGLVESRIEPAVTPGQPAANRTWTASYDAAGLVTREAQPGGVILTRTFDEAGRPLTETGTGATGSRSFSYDAEGRVATVSHPSSVINVTYDDRGLPLSVTGGAGSATYTWNTRGELTQRSDVTGTASFTFDDAGRVIEETDPLTGGKAEYGYDDAGRRTYVGSYGPSLAGWPNTPVRWTGSDDYGRISWDVLVPNSTGDPDTFARSYGFDDDGNLYAVNVWGSSNPADDGFQWFEYDSRGQLAESWTGGVKTGYDYDKSGNRTKAGATTYTYDAQNRLTGDSAGASYTWTDRGMLASVTKGSTTTTSTFDVWGQALTNGTVTMTYDGLGRIATRNSVGFQYSGTSIDPVFDGTWYTNHGVDGDVLSVSQASGANARWAVNDNNHNIVALRNPATGHVDNTTDFNPYGAVRGTTGTLSPTVGYQGDYTDPTTDEVWMGARHYNPSTATFTSRDTYPGRLEQPVSLNRYTYAHNNPLTLWDPNGHAPTDQDRINLMQHLAGINVAAYAKNNNMSGLQRSANAAFEAYRLTEAAKLIDYWGLDAAKWFASYHSVSVVDPVIMQASLALSAQFVAAKPKSKNVAAGPSGVSIDVVPSYVAKKERTYHSIWIEESLNACMAGDCTALIDSKDVADPQTMFANSIIDKLIRDGILKRKANGSIIHADSKFGHLKFEVFGRVNDWTVTLNADSRHPVTRWVHGVIDFAGVLSAGVSTIGFGACLIGFAPGCAIGASAALVGSAASVAGVVACASEPGKWDNSCTLTAVGSALSMGFGGMSLSLGRWANGMGGKGVSFADSATGYTLGAAGYYSSGNGSVRNYMWQFVK